MKILQVVTLVSETGAFGGPLRVALNQSKELSDRGHDVTLVAGWEGSAPAKKTLLGVESLLFPVRQAVPRTGFSGLWALGLMKALRELTANTHVAHVHMGRDLVTVSAAAMLRRAGIPLVVQTHGMVGEDGRLKSKVFDALFLRRLVQSAAVRLALGPEEAEALRNLVGIDYPVAILKNGVSMPEQQWRAAGNDVLYCARLHERKRPLAFVDMARELIDRQVNCRFSIVGPDEGELDIVERAIRDGGLVNHVKYEGPLHYAAILDRMQSAMVYVLPSVDEPFPMSLLEAMSLGVPSVCTSTCHISDALRHCGAAIVTDGTAKELADAVQLIMEDANLRGQLSRRARSTVERLFSIEAVVDELERCYEDVV